jgi:hypothetical protein
MEFANNRASDPALVCGDPRCQTPDARVWYCDDCGSKICGNCWSLQVSHQPGKVGRDNKAHERADPVVVEVYKKILNPPVDAKELEDLHAADASSCWFGKGCREAFVN